MRSFVGVIFLIAALLAVSSANEGGARIRLSKKGMQYAAILGVTKLKSELASKGIKDVTGKSGDVEWGVRGIKIHYLNIPSYSLSPVAGVGLRAAVGGISLKLSGRVSYKYKKGWIKISDSSNVEVKANGVGFNVAVRITSKGGRPAASAASCSASISNIDLDFSGGAGWIYNLFSGILEGKIKDELKELMCKEGNKLINQNADKMLSSFPVTKAIDKWAIINYQFMKPQATSTYFDLLLKGEFQKRSNPGSSGLPAPTMDVTSAADKMIYIWLSDYTINTAGKVYHEAGFLNRVIKPTDKLIPDSVKPFLNTDSFKKVVPQLAVKYPNRPIQFLVGSYKPPVVTVSPGNIKLDLFATIRIVVETPDGKNVPVFYVNLDISATGGVSVTSDYRITGKITDFTFKATIGGSVIGVFVLPVDSPAVKNMVKGLVIDSGNPMLEKGFPLPKIDDLTLINPRVTFVKNAIRIDTDVNYRL